MTLSCPPCGIRRSALSFALLVFCSTLNAADQSATTSQSDVSRDSKIDSVSIQGSSAQIALDTCVGTRYDVVVIERDVRNLHATGKFSDVRVEAEETDRGKHITFYLREAPRLMLGAVRTSPEELRLKAEVPAGTPIDMARAYTIASEFRRQLSQAGYLNTNVQPELVPSGVAKADLILHVQAEDPVRIRQVTLVGEPGLGRKEILNAGPSLKGKRVLPAIPGVWKGWTLAPTYNESVTNSELERIRSLYLSRGYFDASVRLDHTDIAEGKATLKLRLDLGKAQHVRGWTALGPGGDLGSGAVNGGFRKDALCKCLLGLRRAAERDGVLDFSARLSVHPVQDQADPGTSQVGLVANVHRGQPYRIRRIDFEGNNRISDSAIRANFILQETDLLDSALLRKSIDRLNRSSLFEPVSETSVDVATDEKSAVADIRVRLKERKTRSWMLSGPVGPMSRAGSLQFTLASRLPSWGHGVLDLSLWSASFSVLAYSQTLASLMADRSEKGLVPVLALQRPFMPSHAWTSGVTIAPKLGWRGTLVNYASMQLLERILPWIGGPQRVDAALPVTVERPTGDAVMFCDPRAPKLHRLRRGTAMALQIASAVPLF